MMTVLNVRELQRKLSRLNVRRTIGFNEIDIIKVLDFKGSKKYFNLSTCAFDKKNYRSGYYSFTVSDRPLEKSNIQYTLIYQYDTGVEEVK